MPTSLHTLVNEFLARPEIKARLRQANESDRRKRVVASDEEASADAPRPLEHFAWRGTWTAAEIEPYLASPRSSLNPAHCEPHTLGYGDDEP